QLWNSNDRGALQMVLIARSARSCFFSLGKRQTRHDALATFRPASSREASTLYINSRLIWRDGLQLLPPGRCGPEEHPHQWTHAGGCKAQRHLPLLLRILRLRIPSVLTGYAPRSTCSASRMLSRGSGAGLGLEEAILRRLTLAPNLK